MTADPAGRKAALRAEVLTARAALAERALEMAADRLTAIAEQEWSDAGALAAYLSGGHEPPTRRLVARLAGHGVRVLLPVVAGDSLQWSWFEGETALSPGRFGLLEPTGPTAGPEALAAVAAILVPALGVDRRGRRLGRGRGYYDRALAGVRTPAVAVVYDDELRAEIPAEPHDRPVDAALTPGGLVRFG